MKLYKWILTFLKENVVIVLLILAAWAKLFVLDAIMFDDPKNLSAIIFLAFTGCSAALIYIPSFLFNKAKLWVALLLNLIFTFSIWADLVYFRYFGSLIKIESWRIANQAAGVSDSIVSLMSPLDALLFIDSLLLVAYLFLRPKRIATPKPLKERAVTFVTLLLLVLLPIGVIFRRDRVNHVYNFLYRNYDINSIEFRYGALGAHGFNTARYVIKLFEHLDKQERKAAIDWVRQNAVGQTDNSFTGQAKGKNIFIIQVESLESFVVGSKYQGLELTPNLNALIRHSYYNENGQTAIGGGTTSDSDFATNTSIYPLRDESAMVQYGKDDFTSLPKALKENGYTANAYHAYRRDFWNRGVAFNSLGYDHFFAKEEYQAGEKIGLGLNDESFYKQTLDKLVVSPDKPALNYLITLSSHHPFRPSPLFGDFPTEGADLTSEMYNYLRAVHYMDYSLGIFLQELKSRGLYDDSLIIVYGDHYAKMKDFDLAKMESMIGTITPQRVGLTPYIYKLPNQKTGVRLTHVTNQLDIMPTVLNLVGIKTDYPMFGGDALTGVRRPIKIEEAKHYSDLMIRFNLFKDFLN